MSYRRKICELEVEYVELPKDYQKRIERVIREQFIPRNYAQEKSKQGVAFAWPMFTAVQPHGAQIGGKFKLEERHGNKLVLELYSAGIITRSTLEGLESRLIQAF